MLAEFATALQALVVATVLPHVARDLHGYGYYGYAFSGHLVAQFVITPLAGGSGTLFRYAPACSAHSALHWRARSVCSRLPTGNPIAYLETVPKIPFPPRKVSKDVAAEELLILERTYPHAQTALHFTSPYELIVAVILSAQCTDARVNATTPALFKKYPTPEKLAKAKQEAVEGIIKSCGFFRAKARNIVNCARALVEDHAGEVPREREQLEALAGVGRKTASVVLSVAFEKATIAVDTHVFRVAHRLGLTLGKTPRDVEHDLESIVPCEKWRHVHHWLILHGRAICKAPVPLCAQCPLNACCPTPKIISRSLGAPSRRGAADGAAARPARSASARKKG